MNESSLLMLGREALLLMLAASAPPLLASLLAGFLFSVLQAITSIQESTLSVVPKLGAAILALVVAGPWTAGQLARFTSRVLETVAGVGQ